MALFSLVAEHDAKSFTTQLEATSAAEAVSEFFARIYPETAAAFGSSPPRLSERDIIYVTAMKGLVNVWVSCAGREGRYVSLVCVRTSSSPNAA